MDACVDTTRRLLLRSSGGFSNTPTTAHVRVPSAYGRETACGAAKQNRLSNQLHECQRRVPAAASTTQKWW
jgi:hypothetical protein